MKYQKRTSIPIPHPVKTTITNGITYCPWKRNLAFTSRRHLIYGAPPPDHPLWPPTIAFCL